ncbi:MAG: FHA domain-containing protein [Planctomycetes bacterium]|nr:FHA domain-containing protein [Planctomycetota bacterium]
MPAIEITFNGQTERTINLDSQVYVIGRQEGCEIRIDNLGISRAHARLLIDGDGYCVEDMNSSNGTYVNGEQVKRYHLNDSDEIAIGKYLLVYRAGGKPVSGPKITSDANEAGGMAAMMPEDALNTMAMDGDALRKRLEAMHKEKEQENVRATEATHAKGGAKVEMAELKARETEIRMMKKSATLKVVVAVAILAAATVAAYFSLLK